MSDAGHLSDYDDYDTDDCWYCGGDGFVFECFDGFCLDADVGCDDCTRECPECRLRARSVRQWAEKMRGR